MFEAIELKIWSFYFWLKYLKPCFLGRSFRFCYSLFWPATGSENSDPNFLPVQNSLLKIASLFLKLKNSSRKLFGEYVAPFLEDSPWKSPKNVVFWWSHYGRTKRVWTKRWYGIVSRPVGYLLSKFERNREKQRAKPFTGVVQSYKESLLEITRVKKRFLAFSDTPK